VELIGTNALETWTNVRNVTQPLFVLRHFYRGFPSTFFSLYRSFPLNLFPFPWVSRTLCSLTRGVSRGKRAGKFPCSSITHTHTLRFNSDFFQVNLG